MIVQTLAVHIWSTCILLYMVTVLGVCYLVECTVYSASQRSTVKETR